MSEMSRFYTLDIEQIASTFNHLLLYCGQGTISAPVIPETTEEVTRGCTALSPDGHRLWFSLSRRNAISNADGGTGG
jgi:hypothetical protein